MEINKQLFENILSGKLKGTFVLRNGEEISSNELIRSNSYYSKTHPYKLQGLTYASNGLSSLSGFKYHDDIIDFIQDTDMKENELTIEIPQGQEIDWQESAKQEKIVFKKKDTKPRSWGEYERMVLKDIGYKDSSTDTINITFPDLFTKVTDHKFLQEHTAFIKLCMLRKAWIGDWKPNLKDDTTKKWCITFQEYEIKVNYFHVIPHPLSFPTEEMAEDFMNCFKDLLEVAKPLI